MTDHATPNLPARNFDATAAFYGSLGFAVGWRDTGWMILRRGDMMLEFFLHPDLDPGTSWFSCCLRLDNVMQFFESALAAGIAEADTGWPRLHRPTRAASGEYIGALVDHDGSLLRLVEN